MEFFDQIVQFIQSNITLAPWVIFGLLLLAGFNVPISEDAMLFISATLAASYPDYLVGLFLGVYAGAYFSDLICFSLGRYFGDYLLTPGSFFSRFVKKEKITKVSFFYEKYGIITLILGRFIPFGVRNALFLTAGIGKMNILKFALSDLLACTISCSLFFTLYYKLGKPVIEYVKKGNVVIFGIALVVVAVILILKRKKKSEVPTEGTEV